MKLFWRIFLSFWIATILMVWAVVGASEIYSFTFPGDPERGFEPELARSALVEAVNAYERGGPTALSSELQNQPSIRRKSDYLFDQDGKVLVGDSPPPSLYELLAKDVLQSGHTKFRRYFGLRTLFAWPIQSATGRRYAAVLTVFERMGPLNPRRWFNLTIAMVPAALVCAILTLYLTRPITRLRAAAQRLAGGDLNARAAPPKIARRDELGDLARDFDSMAARIQSLMTAQRRFVADVSHELGSPLTRMHLAVALLRRQLPEENNGALMRLERETGKLSNLVQQLLLLAGLEAGRCPAETLASISILSLCEDIIQDANFEAAHANCRIVGSRQDVIFPIYPNLLRRAIDNVLRNAIRYSPAGSEIRFDCRLSEDMQHVTLEIADCGPGVPESMLSDIFQPFFRTAPGRESSSGGTGLGLAIASEAVQFHDGTILARNGKNGGLHVTITLPLRNPTPDSEAQPSVVATP